MKGWAAVEVPGESEARATVANSNLAEVLCLSTRGPQGHANQRLHTGQPAVTIWPHNPHSTSTLARVCNGDQVSLLTRLSLAVSV